MKNTVNVAYILLYILVPVILFFLLIVLTVSSALLNNSWAVIPIFLFSVLIVLWFALVPMITPNIFRKSAYKKLMRSGFHIEREYRSSTYTLLIDINGGKVAMLFPFNPFTASVVSAGNIQRIWIKDRSFAGDNSTSNVSVHFSIFNKVTTYTTYNQRFGKMKVYLPMNHPTVVSALQKANAIAFELNEAWKHSVRFNQNIRR